MSKLQLVDLDQDIRRAFDAGDWESAARLAFERYGREISSFLRARLRSDEHGQEVFAMFAEDLWTGFAGFHWRCSVRCFLYVLARNASNRYMRAPERKPQRNEPLSQHASQLAISEALRQPTEPHRDTSVKDKIRALREQLSDEDRTLLFLRVDRGLAWSEIAIVLHDGERALDPDEQTREAARLRKRFERLKLELRRLARAAGLIRR